LRSTTFFCARNSTSWFWSFMSVSFSFCSLTTGFGSKTEPRPSTLSLITFDSTTLPVFASTSDRLTPSPDLLVTFHTRRAFGPPITASWAAPLVAGGACVMLLFGATIRALCALAVTTALAVWVAVAACTAALTSRFAGTASRPSAICTPPSFVTCLA
jgi:hypothetical protein